MARSSRSMGSTPFATPRLKLCAILLSAFLVRMGLLLRTGASEVLQDRPELSTPVNSWKALLEATFLFQQSPESRHKGTAGPYAAGTIHHSPLLVTFLQYPLTQAMLRNDKFAASSIWALADVVSGWLLYYLCTHHEASRAAQASQQEGFYRSRALKVTAIFLFNPYTIATCAARSSVTLEVAATLSAISAAMNAAIVPASLLWALASLLSLYPILLMPMLTQLAMQKTGERVYQKEVDRVIQTTLATDAVKRPHRQLGFLVDRVRSAKRWTLVKSIVLFPAALAGGLWLSRAIVVSHKNATAGPFLAKIAYAAQMPMHQGWDWFEQVYGTTLLMAELTPNLGLWWYFFTEMFDHFRNFFLLTFNVHVASYVLPFSIKQDPLFGLTLMCGVIAVFKSYPTMGDHALFFGLLSLHSQIFEYLRYPMISAMVYIYCTFLSPAFHHLWLTAGSANSNFFYAITLVWALGGGMLVLDSMWAWGRERWEQERAPLRLRATKGALASSDIDTEVLVGKREFHSRKRVVVQV